MTTETTNLDLADARRKYTPMADTDEVRRNYEYDMRRFVEHSSTTDINPDPAALEAVLASVAHALEKGLAMEETRAAFGVGKLPLTMASIRELESTGRAGSITEGARECIRAYIEHHDSLGLRLPAELETELREFVTQASPCSTPGGSLTMTRNEIKRATSFDYDKFVRSRYSVRHFTGGDVTADDIRTAVQRALKTPRVCNRETRRVYAAYDADLRNHLLTFHHGNRGFGHRLGAVLVITSDLRGFDMIGERNQPYVDGGLFAMSLAFAFHAAGLGACMMNWSEDCTHDELLRREFNIPDNEVIITFLGVGHLPEHFQVAASPSPRAEDVLSELAVRQDDPVAKREVG